MDKTYITILFIIVGVIVIRLFDNRGRREHQVRDYHYDRKQYLLTPPEQKFFHTLVSAVGHEYCIFAQVHLSNLLEHKIKGQNWLGAFRHIDEKSVDFVLCDKRDTSPLLAIELDDVSHERSDRVQRDAEVERILDEAELPLLRVEVQASYDADTIADGIKQKLSNIS